MTRLSDNKLIGGDFGAFVDAQMNLFSRQLAIRNSEEEGRFNEQVLSGNLSLSDQLAWRQAQLKRISNDPTERKRIRSEIASLKDRVQQKQYQDDYMQKLSDFNSGIGNIDSVVNWLTTQAANTTDENLKQTIQQNLADAKAKQFDLQKQVIENHTQYAIADKTDTVINTQLDNVRSARAQAALSGNDQLVSVYDLQVQSLEKALTENSIAKSTTAFAVSTMTNHMNSTGLLDAYNGKVADASSTGGPINIGGSQFASENEYWKYQRGQYLTDTSSSGFFTRFTTEQTQNLGILNAKGTLTGADIQSTSKAYDSLASRTELQGFDQQIAGAKQDAIQSGTDLIANNILNSFYRTYDVNSAVSQLNQLKTYGGNVDTVLGKVIDVGSQIKNQQVQQINQTASDIKANNPDTPISDAIDQASKQGAGTVLSPDQLVSGSATDIAKQGTTISQNQTGGNDTRTTTAPGDVKAPTIQQTQETPPTAAQDAQKFNFTDQLDFGATGDSVKSLQQFLNKAGYAVAADGQPGSVGNETNYFGPATQTALQKFQASKGIVSSGDPTSTGYGRLGPQTIQAINSYQFS